MYIFWFTVYTYGLYWNPISNLMKWIATTQTYQINFFLKDIRYPRNFEVARGEITNESNKINIFLYWNIDSNMITYARTCDWTFCFSRHLQLTICNFREEAIFTRTSTFLDFMKPDSVVQ